MGENGKRERSLFSAFFPAFFAGGGSGVITKTAIAPLERVKILMQLQGMHKEQAPKYTGILQTMRLVVKEEGFFALYKGNGANVLRIIPTYALKFAFNDTYKAAVCKSGQDPKNLSFLQLVGAGTLAGSSQILITYPLETVRTRLTLQAGFKGIHYTGIADCAGQTIAHEGYLGLYKGFLPTLLSGSPYVGLQMTFFAILKDAIPANFSTSVNTVCVLLAGAASGLVAQTITYPGDTIRRRLQTNGMNGQPKVYNGLIHAITKTYQTEGSLAFFKGWGANAIRCLPGAAIQFLAFDTLNGLVKTFSVDADTKA